MEGTQEPNRPVERNVIVFVFWGCPEGCPHKTEDKGEKEGNENGET